MISIIKPEKGWQPLNVREILRFKDLLYFLVLRGIKARYAQSVLGIGWAIIQPLFATGIFTVVFGKLAGIDSDGVPYAVFAFCALVPWGYFSATLTESTNSLLTNASMLSKVYFPRIVLPVSAAIAKFLDFFIALVVLVFFLFYFQITPSFNTVFVPVLVAILILSSLGLGMILGAMSVQYRDIKHASAFMVQILMYAAPVVYPASKVPANWLFYYSLNPMVGVIEGFRSAFLNTREMPWEMIGIAGISSVVLFLFGIFYFKRIEKSFADVV